MYKWIKQSFKRQIIFTMLTAILLIGSICIAKFYTDEKAQLNALLYTQVSQMGQKFSLGVSSKVFDNNYFELSADILNLLQYNQSLAQESGSVFKINAISIINIQGNIIAHSDPVNYRLNTKFKHRYKSLEDEEKNLIWNEEKTILYAKTSIKHDSETIAYLIMEIDSIFLHLSQERLITNIFLLSTLLLFVLFTVSLFFTKFIDKPINEIIHKLEDLGEGTLSFEFTTKRDDEFAMIAKALILADRRIHKQNTELIDIQIGLEEEINKHTNELKIKAEEHMNTVDNLKKFQKQLVETEKMSALGSLVAGVAHEINTPLGVSITGITCIQAETKEIIKQVSDQKLSKSNLDNFLQSIAEMSSSMYISLISAAKLVRSFKQIAIDQHTEDKRNFNLKEYFDEVLLSLHNKLKHEPIMITLEVDETININSYAGIFSQILTNFIMNSLIHAFDKDNKNQEIVIKGWTEDGSLYITYEDNGKGINEEDVSKIFNPFFTTKLGQGGSGLGLNIIYNLINHKLNGDIYCQRKEPGMRMIISIPLILL